ncbi:T9SS type A sorting domain-containing protein [Portibacter lacus]|uniref:Secretion system C-terminal sorting domain-containing protein n=1 Tax=Portibacter lacus TaxID=1099794 RepID=A0AA37SNC9_9BACT|nr:T9SS type A sorting domain-containing protein [Portibacter lacus]GLR16669.1 hypothetical protein GCM10007940_12840 [Portibacter lacus]
MKISLPARDTFKLICLLFVFSFPNIVNAQCDDCPTTTDQTLTKCDGVAFTIADITVGDEEEQKYYESCDGSGSLDDEILSSTYSGSADFIYVEDINTEADPDTCVTIFRVALVRQVETATINAPGILCGEDDVTLSATLSGAGSSYSWTAPEGSTGPYNMSTYEASKPGAHGLTVDVDGCTVVADDVTVSESDLAVSISMDPASGEFCDGESVTLTALATGGGIGSLTYLWSTASGSMPTDVTIAGATNGAYSVTATRNSCSVGSSAVTITKSNLAVSLVKTQDVSCFGGDDGEIQATVTGGSGSYSFELNGGTASSGSAVKTFSGLEAGNYSVSVTDTGGSMCSVNSTMVNVPQPASAMSIALSPTSPTTIGGNNGSINVNVSNGMSGYTWKQQRTLLPGPVVSGSSGSEPFDIPMLTSGTYNVTVTDSKSCVATGSTVIVPLACSLNINSATPTASSCAGESDGEILVNTTGWTTSYTISWSGASSGTSSTQTSNNYTITGLAPGNYNVSAKDLINCEKNFNMTVVIDPATPINASASATHGACIGDNNGAIQVTGISGGTGPYVVSWNSPNNMVATSGPTATIPGLVSGPYSISVTDSKGCVKPLPTVNVAPLSPTAVTISGDDEFCFDQTSGTLTTSPSGFKTYAWSSGGGGASISITNPGASPKNYTVTVTDNNDCEDTDIISVSRLNAITITLNVSASKTSVTCDSDTDGRIDINKTGGTGNYNYSWSGPNGFSRTTEDIDNLGPGVYTLNITDSNGCLGTFMQEITTPLPISVSVSPSDAICNGESNGAVSVSATGGTLPYTYKWAPGGATSSSISNLSAGTYTVTVTDKNGCFKVESAQVKQPDAVVGLIDPSSVQICNGESISLTVDGGTSYAWNNGLGTNPTVTVSPTTTTTYSVIVTDAATNNCTDDASVTVTVNPLPVAKITVSETSGLANNDSKLCEGDPITLTASGGSTYNWSGGLSNPVTLSPNAGNETYVVTVTDSKGCKDTESIDVEINQNPTPLIDFSGASQTSGDFQTIKNVSIANCGTLTDCSWTVEGSPADGDCVDTKPTFTSDGSKNIKLSVTNSCGCSAEKTEILEIFKSDLCAIREFTVNNSLGIACVGKMLNITTLATATPGCNIQSRNFDVFQNGTLVPASKYDYTVDDVVFHEAGTYEMRFAIEDDCSCNRSSTRTITVVPAPSIGFASNNITSGCEGESITVNFSDFDAGEKVVVEYSDGSTFTYESSSFEFQLGSNLKETLTIVSVQNASCKVDVVGKKIEIDVTPKFKIESKTSDCKDDGLSYTYTIRTSGGDPNESIIADGIAGTQSGNNYIIPNLDPTQTYEFTLIRGDICESILVEIPMITCNCTFAVGENIATGFSGCENDVFDITNIFKVNEEEFDPSTDTLIYVLHNQNTGLNLGPVVYKVYPYSTTTINNDFDGFIPNLTTYRLSVVGIRKAQLGDFDFENPSSIAGDGANRCMSVVSGVPITWYAEPNLELGTVNNEFEICRNAYDFMIFPKNNAENFTISYAIEGVPDEFIRDYGFRDTAFVYFKDNGQDSFNVTLFATKEYFDGETTFSCEGESTFTLYVKDGKGSPPLSEIILWPGNILASTADSSTTCFEWGFESFGQNSGVIGTDKYLYAASDIDFSTTSRIYYVDTYFCDNPDCVTRVYYNAEGPKPRAGFKVEKTFSYQVKPNPNRGDFELDLFSDFDGNFDYNIIDITGKRVLNKKASVAQGRNIERFNLNGIEKGIYFIQIINKDLNEYSIDKLVIN